MAESVASRNIFDLLKDDAPDAEVGFNIPKPTTDKPVKAAAKPQARPAFQNERSAGNTGSTNQRRGGSRPQGQSRNFDRDAAPSGRDFSDKPKTFGSRSRGQSNFPRRREDGDAPRGRRQFDRHSGTGIEDSEKKIKQGWEGSDSAVVKDQQEATEQAKVDTLAEDAETPAPEEPVDNTKTLQEYLAEKMTKLQVQEQKEVRKANEGVDKSLLKATEVLIKEEESFFVGKSVSKAKKSTKTQREKVHIDFTPKFAPIDRPRRGERSERGGKFGNRKPRTAAIKVNSEAEFPSLG
ncbi:hypothetical protein BB561_001741 [Smittium simulii]|uniref:Hyaluronan/mRNA-binding protein domain-containing protein n=1 Tax=Smittium simulii TaxID=133385 RepID=A0A2T9YT86_9FUNG|nr:hypothetical protein BB561_001741 [Smittium simulii]